MTMRLHYSIALLLAVGAVLSCGPRGRAAETAVIDYAQPAVLSGTVYEMASGTNKILYHFKRTATRSNSTVRAVRDFSHPNGSLAAREVMVYEHGRLVSFFLDEKQTGAQGSTTLWIDPRDATKQKLRFDWTAGPGDGGKKKTDDETLQPDSLVSDMIGYFIAAHWNELSRGEAVNFRFVAQSRLETVGFKLVRESELAVGGVPSVRIKMEPSSFIIAQLVDPLFFVVEKASPHRVLEYTGRTTPKARAGNKWKDLDARTVFNWN